MVKNTIQGILKIKTIKGNLGDKFGSLIIIIKMSLVILIKKRKSENICHRYQE